MNTACLEFELGPLGVSGGDPMAAHDRLSAPFCFGNALTRSVRLEDDEEEDFGGDEDVDEDMDDEEFDDDFEDEDFDEEDFDEEDDDFDEEDDDFDDEDDDEDDDDDFDDYDDD